MSKNDSAIDVADAALAFLSRANDALREASQLRCKMAVDRLLESAAPSMAAHRYANGDDWMAEVFVGSWTDNVCDIPNCDHYAIEKIDLFLRMKEEVPAGIFFYILTSSEHYKSSAKRHKQTFYRYTYESIEAERESW